MAQHMRDILFAEEETQKEHNKKMIDQVHPSEAILVSKLWQIHHVLKEKEYPCIFGITKEKTPFIFLKIAEKEAKIQYRVLTEEYEFFDLQITVRLGNRKDVTQSNLKIAQYNVAKHCFQYMEEEDGIYLKICQLEEEGAFRDRKMLFLLEQCEKEIREISKMGV